MHLYLLVVNVRKYISRERCVILELNLKVLKTVQPYQALLGILMPIAYIAILFPSPYIYIYMFEAITFGGFRYGEESKKGFLLNLVSDGSDIHNRYHNEENDV